MHVKGAANGIAICVAVMHMHSESNAPEPGEPLDMSLKLQKDYGPVAIGWCHQ